MPAKKKEAAKKRGVCCELVKKPTGAALFTTTHKKAHVHGRPDSARLQTCCGRSE